MSEIPKFIIDTHFHIWDLNKFHYLWPRPEEEKIICKNMLIEDYEEARKLTPIQYSVFIECVESIEETRWALDLAENSTFLKGVVGFVNLTSERLEETVIELKRNPNFVGTRKILMFCEDDWLLREDVLMGMRVLEKYNLTFDLLIQTEAQYKAAKEFLKVAPENLKIVLDHLGKPDAKTGAPKQWYEDIQVLASYPNVYCKLSGMVTEGNLDSWKPMDFKSQVDHVVKQFGVDRVMFGSDWPVCKLAGAELVDMYELVKGLTDNLNPRNKAKVFGGNAVKFYNLQIE